MSFNKKVYKVKLFTILRFKDMIKKMNLIKTVFIASSILIFDLGLEAQTLENSKPNIIVIMPDDSSYGNHSCFGNPVIKTPNIDALKKESLLLTRYHSSARCSPSEFAAICYWSL